MIYKCPNCNGALKYNPTEQKMACHYCGGVFPVSELAPEADFESSDLFHTETDNTETLSYNIYICTACGGELAVSGVEASTFCPYCGQPTIVFHRVTQEVRPNRILPFKLSKEQVINQVREHFGKITYAVDEIKNFKVELVRGIYIPFRIYDIHYHDTRTYTGSKAKDNQVPLTEDTIFIREAECNYQGIMVDASSILDNAEVQKLAPFDFEELHSFQPEYLSGFYTDLSDVNNKTLTENAIEQADALFSRELEQSIRKDDGFRLTKREANPQIRIQKEEYVLLPVWFLTFRHKNEPCTILVNGQTGKIVGLSPFDRKKFWNTFWKYTSAIGIPLGIFSILLTILAPGIIINLFFSMGFMALIAGIIGIFNYMQLQKCFKEQKNDLMAKFVKERQEEL